VHYLDAKSVTSALLQPLLGQLLVEIVHDFIDKELTREGFFFWEGSETPNFTPQETDPDH
jgi:hypothetical protein